MVNRDELLYKIVKKEIDRIIDIENGVLPNGSVGRELIFMKQNLEIVADVLDGNKKTKKRVIETIKNNNREHMKHSTISIQDDARCDNCGKLGYVRCTECNITLCSLVRECKDNPHISKYDRGKDETK